MRRTIAIAAASNDVKKRSSTRQEHSVAYGTR
jgi:hypothetical protein